MKPVLVRPVEIHSAALDRSVKLGIYQPDDIESPKVIIAFDGQDLAQIAQLHKQYEALNIHQHIIVFVHYPNVKVRSEEYHPHGDKRSEMMTFIHDELLNYLQAHYNINTDDILLIGDSLAASIALMLTIQYPAFNKAALFSPMLTDELIAAAVQTDADYYIAVGDEEFEFTLKDGTSADFLTPIQKLHDTLNQNGKPHYYKELSGSHNWKTWKPEIENVLNYYFL
ncbi:esterase family protein [Macrococcoides canis]|uniref:alpha/beta hydrolase n=1 Tax=Macrococcoides canis TaxID=1855823 RepID=UPI00105BB081|nr:alpha/beta hydrolase-fold protein [Macrococcus canis]TDM32408.1 esterase family protein [Macrococcus canis]